MMEPVKFDIKKDLAPIPFDENVCQLALKMKVNRYNTESPMPVDNPDPENQKI